mmetsp:Transcript_129689/g.225286  ORF Transcript_129689/g.225286 Transcript_129689/m.225286 type:complete len:234 (+) Transcript_129689:1672-2373(+)
MADPHIACFLSVPRIFQQFHCEFVRFRVVAFNLKRKLCTTNSGERPHVMFCIFLGIRKCPKRVKQTRFASQFQQPFKCHICFTSWHNNISRMILVIKDNCECIFYGRARKGWGFPRKPTRHLRIGQIEMVSKTNRYCLCAGYYVTALFRKSHSKWLWNKGLVILRCQEQAVSPFRHSYIERGNTLVLRIEHAEPHTAVVDVAKVCVIPEIKILRLRAEGLLQIFLKHLKRIGY